MPKIKVKKKVKIAEARRFKDYIGVSLEEEGKVFGGVSIYNLEATPEEIDEAIKKELYVEVGEKIPELEGREIEVEYEVEE